MDICCCKTARKLPPPSQDEGLLLRFFRTFYVPFLLHWLTRVVVVSGREGSRGTSCHPGLGGPGSVWGGRVCLALILARGHWRGLELAQVQGLKPGQGGVAEIQVGPAPECFLQDPVQTQTGKLLTRHWAGGFHATLPFPGAAVPGPVRSKSLFHVLR